LNKKEFVIFTSLCHQLKQHYGISFTEFIPKDRLDVFLKISEDNKYLNLSKDDTADILKEVLEDYSKQFN
jgi:hypothetical protein